MIVYSATREAFTRDVLTNEIDKSILAAFKQRLGRSTSQSEILSWRNSMQYMNNALSLANTPADAWVAIE